jgi:hypothetical protein
MEESSLLIMVTKVQRHKEQLKSGLGLGKIISKIFRLLRADAKFSLSSVEQEEPVHAVAPANIYHNSHREIRNTLLNAEFEKAQAIMELQRRSSIR